MDKDERSAIADQLLVHEGLRLHPYTDTVGKLTIGVGRNLTDRGITREEAMAMLAGDIDRCVAELYNALPWFAALDDVRKRVLVDMDFNMGLTRLLEFRQTLAAVEAGDYALAAERMLESMWARQVGERAHRLARMMKTGAQA